jgi:hypothetical protein
MRPAALHHPDYDRKGEKTDAREKEGPGIQQFVTSNVARSCVTVPSRAACVADGDDTQEPASTDKQCVYTDGHLG